MKRLSIFAALLWLVAGCSMTPLQRMDYAGKAIGKTWTHTYPLFKSRCVSEAQKCASTAGSQPTSLPDCPGAAKCLVALKAFKTALDAGDAAIIVGTPLAVEENPTAAGWSKMALDALSRAVTIARESGLLPGGAP